VLVAASVYGALLWVGVFPSRWQWYYLGLVFVVAVAAGAVMTLAWSLLYEVMPEDERGSSAGLADATKGVGLLLGPALTGLAIDLAHGRLSATDGYAIMWPVLAVPILASLPVVRSLR
jgi:MFS family permease